MEILCEIPMKFKVLKRTLFVVLILALLVVIVWFVGSLNIVMLDPKGIIALKERNLIVFTVILGLAVIIPVFIMASVIAWRYRESNTKALYTPNEDTNHLAEIIWWGIPITIITVLSVVTWISTHNLDPYKPLPGHEKTITIQVISLDWKWLFIYPDQNIATVNFVQFPTDTSVNFDLTSDTVMNSFWVPQLSGQLYAMPGMTTKLHLNATEPGDYKGSSSNISGEGFAGMKFTARASSQADFDSWVKKAKQSSNVLSHSEYKKLAAKSMNNPVTTYGSTADDLYDTIVMKYMMPTNVDSAHNDSKNTKSDEINHSKMKDMDTH